LSGVTRVAPELCYTCGYLYDAVSPRDGSTDTPVPGNWAICINCGEVAVFGLDLRRRPLTEAERRDLDDGDRELMRRAKADCMRAQGVDLAKRGGRT
jgi:hypothetical protein